MRRTFGAQCGKSSVFTASVRKDLAEELTSLDLTIKGWTLSSRYWDIFSMFHEFLIVFDIQCRILFWFVWTTCVWIKIMFKAPWNPCKPQRYVEEGFDLGCPQLNHPNRALPYSHWWIYRRDLKIRAMSDGSVMNSMGLLYCSVRNEAYIEWAMTLACVASFAQQKKTGRKQYWKVMMKI